jgi:hypothetical protein
MHRPQERCRLQFPPFAPARCLSAMARVVIEPAVPAREALDNEIARLRGRRDRRQRLVVEYAPKGQFDLVSLGHPLGPVLDGRGPALRAIDHQPPEVPLAGSSSGAATNRLSVQVVHFFVVGRGHEMRERKGRALNQHDPVALPFSQAKLWRSYMWDRGVFERRALLCRRPRHRSDRNAALHVTRPAQARQQAWPGLSSERAGGRTHLRSGACTPGGALAVRGRYV